MWPEGDPIAPRDVGAAAALAAPFALGLIALLVAMPPTAAQAGAADPLIQLLRGPIAVVPIAVLVLGAWIAAPQTRPDRAALRRALGWAAAGAAAAGLVALGIFAAVGHTLPSFIPPEESARAGLTNGEAAGLVEEVVFRFAVVPLTYALARREANVHSAIAMAALVGGLTFALSHELGPAGGAFEIQYVATRFVFPGVVMSLVFLRLHPAFIVTAHLTAHFVIPALFH